MRHEKTYLNVFVVVIPKEDGRAHPSFGMTLTLEFESFGFIDHVL